MTDNIETETVETVAEETKTVTKAAKTKAKTETQTAQKRTQGTLISKANYTIHMKHNGQALLIPPYGRVKVFKELCEFNTADTRYLTFIKL